ncbi:MAG: hypothetical protein ACOC3D_00025 [Pseudomonadota bacterium]
MRHTLAITALAAAAALAGTSLAQNLDPALVTQPADVRLHQAPAAELEEMGAQLFADPSLGATGASCATCHEGFQNYRGTFAEPYPHFVRMGRDMAGMDEVKAAEMVQLCMVVPMGADPLPWDSVELAALTAYVEAERARFAAR